jgi:hypothetical protein
VLAEGPAVFHVSLDGPEDRRFARAVQLGPIDEATARRQMIETDQARARYLKRLYGAVPADPCLSHRSWIPRWWRSKDSVELIDAAAAAMWHRDPPRRSKPLIQSGAEFGRPIRVAPKSSRCLGCWIRLMKSSRSTGESPKG